MNLQKSYEREVWRSNVTGKPYNESIPWRRTWGPYDPVLNDVMYFAIRTVTILLFDIKYSMNKYFKNISERKNGYNIKKLINYQNNTYATVDLTSSNEYARKSSTEFTPESRHLDL